MSNKPLQSIKFPGLADTYTIENDIENFASAYSTSSTYSVGEYVTYEGDFYRCITAISTAEAWTPAHWEQVTVGEELSDYKAEINQLAENGYYTGVLPDEYYTLSSGQISSGNDKPVDQKVTVSSNTGYIIIPKNSVPTGIKFDTTKYKANIFFVKNEYIISGTYTGWITTSPLPYTAPSDWDAIGINVRKLSGNFTTAELSEALYKSPVSYVGNLATKDDVAKNKVVGSKVIYPDGFSSRVMPDIYFNGAYYADIDEDDYRIGGTGEVWVSTTGNDTTGNGSEDNPYLTLTKALTVTATTIYMKEGTYEQGTHYGNNVSLANKNLIGIGNVVFQNDSSGHQFTISGSCYIKNITFKHGNATTNSTVSADGSNNSTKVCFIDCVFRDGGVNGLGASGIDIICIRCTAFGNRLDGFNYHDRTVNNVTYIPNVLEIDCKAYNNGSADSGSDSCNGSTAHDGSKVIRLNGEYYSCYGGVIAEIARTGEEPTISVNYGVLSHDSTGTGTYKASFWASVNTKMYLYDCKCYGGTYDLSAINDAVIVSRRLTTGRDVPSVNQGSSATVLQY